MSYHNGPRIVTDGLVLLLDAGNIKSYSGSGTTWTDLSGNNNHGTLTNGVGYNSGNKGALSFDGVNDYVDTNLIYNLSSSSTEFSCGCWFRCGSQPSNNVLVSNYNNVPTPFNLYILQNGTVAGNTRNSSGQSIFVSSNNAYNDSRYHNFFYIKDLSDNYYVYVDGSLQNSGNANLNAIISNNTIWIGTLRLFDQGYYNGNIAQVSIYNKALTASEIRQNYNALKGRFNL